MDEKDGMIKKFFIMYPSLCKYGSYCRVNQIITYSTYRTDNFQANWKIFFQTGM